MKTSTYHEGVSAVICCYNSENLIAEALEALQAQENNGVPFEVILVDNNCADHTVDMAREIWRRRDAKLIITAEKRQGLTHARKRGIMSAQYDIVTFIDDDNIVERDWIAKVHRIFKSKPEVGAVGGRNEAILEGEAPLWFFHYMEAYACGNQLPRSGMASKNRKYLWGAGLSFRTEVIKKILLSHPPLYLNGRTGFHVISGEDSEICYRCVLSGWELWYEKDLQLKHKIPEFRLKWSYLCRLYESFGRSWPVLAIYEGLMKSQKPVTYGAHLQQSIRNLLLYLTRFNIRLLGTQPGNDLHLELFFNRGVLKGYLGLQKTYQDIVGAIYEHFDASEKNEPAARENQSPLRVYKTENR